MRNKRATQLGWIMTDWDKQMEQVQLRLQSYKTVRAARVDKQLPWKVIYEKPDNESK